MTRDARALAGAIAIVVWSLAVALVASWSGALLVLAFGTAGWVTVLRATHPSRRLPGVGSNRARRAAPALGTDLEAQQAELEDRIRQRGATPARARMPRGS